MLAAAAQSPIIVRIVQTPEPGLGDIMLRALGLSGLLGVCAILLGLFIGSVIFWMRSRSTATRSGITRPNDPS